MPNPLPLRNPDSFFSTKDVLRLVLLAASMLTLLPAAKVVALSLMTLEPLTLMSLPLAMLTVLPPMLVPIARVSCTLVRVVVLLLLKAPLFVWLRPSLKLLLFSPALMSHRIPLTKGTLVIFDTGQPHAAIERNSVSFNAPISA